ncbi:MAG: PRC-barrel domain containing protein [Mesorhizobium sp.]|uniref:PRC-barrel domain-containing protein n=1 Tax=Mesorhizobium sp. TaxID=1871066 RepID=UPI000FE9FA8F|nr:PRC-barrel domain-containing protein [Mesorhizobium sp.]RWD50890.1 MAG: PRC-barrel domain containing protein [Mesorhizobium sp.]RWE58547.1 MAG: PRC-barrel domain containing protein [Mesorhizobium sp.]RWF09169.1 MAG: PRC-barrel domain containing protein [Mesorhizobium sp.]RWF21418.1 MAG: PRC-barrel domain containing protein [Mesorhizobium sp.]TIM57670.1 MAG: PRC-barrel domain containing protein [Mesorhizobium sp.]
MDHTDHVRLTNAELRADVVEGATIYGRDDEEIGSIDHVHGTGDQAQVVFDVGGFLGIGSKRVALYASQLDFMRDEEGTVHAVTQMTTDQLKELPEHHDS